MRRGAHRGGAAGAGDPTIAGVGIGLRQCHIDGILSERPPLPWLELLADNHLADGGITVEHVNTLARLYPLTLHCVGMNLAGTAPLDPGYLDRIAALHRRSAAAWVSDHLCFTAVDGRHYHELLPFPYTEESLRHVAARVQAVQDRLGTRLVIENVSSYLRFSTSALTEAEFLAELCRSTDCALLLDVNNLYINQINHGEAPEVALAALPLDRVQEIHLAGFEAKGSWLLDAHNGPIAPEVWSLYAMVLERLPAPVPTLIEWDNRIPPLPVLQAEARRAAAIAADAGRAGQSPGNELAGFGEAASLPGRPIVSPSDPATATAGPARLRPVQRLLAAALDGAAEAETSLEPIIAHSRVGPPPRALAVYRDSSQAARERALELVYPVCRAVLGERCFARLAADFVQAYPSLAPDLDRLSAAFPSVFQAPMPGAGLSRSLPYLADLARLESAVHHALVAGADPPWDQRRFAELAAAGRAGEIRLRLTKTATLLQSPWPIAAIRRRHREPAGDTSGVEATAGDRLAVTRWNQRPRVIPLDGDVYRMLRAIADGSTLAGLSEQGHPVERLAELIEQGIIAGFEHPRLLANASERASGI